MSKGQPLIIEENKRIESLRGRLIEYGLNLDEIYPYPYNGLDGKQWKDTLKFSPAAQIFEKNKFYYSPELIGTYDWDRFWDEEEKRIHEGFIHPLYPEQKITGLHYLYLNYCPIRDKKKKRLTFPRFLDFDADYFKRMQEAKDLQKFFCFTKKRQCGGSLKGALPLVFNMFFEPQSVNYLGAYLKGYVDKSWNIMDQYIDHINEYTDFRKKKTPDRQDYIKFAYEEESSPGIFVEKGFKSEVRKLTFNDDFEKSVGGACSLLVYDEAGISNTLNKTVEYMIPALTAGELTTGFMIIFGSVGEVEKSRDLEEYFYKPDQYRFYSIKNIWGTGGNTAYFIPEYLYREPHVDEDGNSDIIGALESILKEREIEKKKSTSAFNFYCSQHPITDREAFASSKTNGFPTVELKKHLVRITTDDKIGKIGYPVELVEDNKVIKPLMLDPTRNQRNDIYPVKQGTNNTGVIWIWEKPESYSDHLYIASFDTVDQGIAESSDSLQALYIYKRDDGKLDSLSKKTIVASYVGRTEEPDTFYKQALYLLRYYNAMCLVENMNIGFINYCNYQGHEAYLQDQMDQIKGINPGSGVKRVKGYHATPEVARHADNLTVKYLLETIGYEYNQDNTIKRKILGLERIKDPGLLEELIRYNKDDNFDRYVSFRGLLLYEEALTKVTVTQRGDTAISQLANISRFDKKYNNKSAKSSLWANKN